MASLFDLIKRFRAPALPHATPAYDRQANDQFMRILRIYFTQLDELLGQIVEAIGRVSPVEFVGGAIDAFGRARFSQPYTLFDSQNRYAKNNLWDETTATGGTVTYTANESTVNLNVTTSSGSEVVRQTYRSFPYQPGKSLLTLNTFVMPTAQANQRIRLGYFNTQNGVFLERNGTAIRIVRRTYVSGAAVDNVVEQADWNGDKLNGTGDSGFTLDLTKAQIFWQDFEWLGVGSVRCGFVIDGQIIICHTFQNANNLTTVYMTTAILPLRYEITNTGATTSSATLKQICSTVISEGGYEKKVALSIVRRTTSLTGIGTTFLPLASIRLASGRTGAVVIPDGYSVLPTTSGDYEVALFKNATLTGASWVASPSANVEYDVSATAVTTTTATLVQQVFFATTNQSGGASPGTEGYNFDLQLGATISGTSDVYTLAIRSLAGSQTAIGSLSFWDLT
jgi:hypothetical protein